MHGRLLPLGLLGWRQLAPPTIPNTGVCLSKQMCGQRCAKGSFAGVSVFVRENVGVAAYLRVFVCPSRVCSCVHVSESNKGQARMCVFLHAQTPEERTGDE